MWNIARITKMWHRGMKRANAFGKNGTDRLALHKVAIKLQFVKNIVPASTIKWSEIKWGMPLAPICHHTKLTFWHLSSMLCNVTDYSHDAAHSIAMTYLFCKWKCVHLDSLSPIWPTPQPPSALAYTILFSVSMNLLVFLFRVFLFVWVFWVFFCFNFTYKWNHMVFVFFVWLMSLSIMPSRSIHNIANSKMSLFFMAE